jgi:hypothetical protein
MYKEVLFELYDLITAREIGIKLVAAVACRFILDRHPARYLEISNPILVSAKDPAFPMITILAD